jgi:hypothetical protein
LASYTASVTGNWSSTATWGGSGPPGAGDTVIIDGAVTVTVDVGTIVGTGSGTAIEMQYTSALAFSTGVDLEVRGNLVMDQITGATGTSITLAAGSGITLNGNSGVSPYIDLYPGGGPAFFTGLANSGSHCYVRTKPGTAGNNGYIRYNPSSTTASYPRFQYCDFTNLGTNTSQAGIDFRIGGNTSQTVWGFSFCTYSGSSLNVGSTASVPSTVTIRLEDSSFSNSITFAGVFAQCCCQFVAGSVTSGGAVSVQRVGFDLYTEIQGNSGSSNGWTVDQVICGGARPILGGSSGFSGTGTVNRVLIYDASPTNGITAGNQVYSNFYYLIHSTADNPHGAGVAAGGTCDGWVTDCTKTVITGDPGDQFFVGSNCTIQRCILLPIASGSGAGTTGINAFSNVGSSNTGGTYLHNTLVCPNAYVVFADTTPAAGAASVMKANLQMGSIFNHGASSDGTNVVMAGDYNGRPGSGGTPYPGCSGLGTHDVTGQNPIFYDSTRSFLTWCRFVQGHNSGTVDTDVAAGMADLIANPSLLGATPNGLLYWVRQGYCPTNTAFEAASYPGDSMMTDANGNAWPGGSPGIGAMGFVFANIAARNSPFPNIAQSQLTN